MKKNLFIMLLVFFATYAHAQMNAEVGVKGGINVSNLSTDANTTYESRTGFHIGPYANLKFGNVGVQPEVLYSQQGTQASFSQAANDFRQDYTYLNIPIMVKFYLVGGLNIHAGPQFGMLLSAKGTTIDDDGNARTLNRDVVNNSDISAAFGAGWDAPFGLSLTVRYLLGLSDISDQSFETKSRIFQISVGYMLAGDR